MKRFFPLIVVIILVVVASYYFVNQEKGDSDSADAVTNARILELSDNPSEMLQFIYDIKSEPTQVMRVYNVLRKLIYSNEYKGKKLERLVNMQRLLYHEDLLAQNQKDLHLNVIESDLQKWKEAEFKLIGSDMLPPVYYGDENDICFIKVVYYTNTPEDDSDIFVKYELLKNEKGQWEILVWDNTKPFDIVK